MTIQNIEQALHLHGEAINGKFDSGGGIGVEVPETAPDIGGGRHLPKQPGQAFGAPGQILWDEFAELGGEIQQDGAGLEDAEQRRTTAIHQPRDF